MDTKKEMKKEMRNLTSWCCKSCGWISEYKITHREYAEGDCKKINRRDMRQTIKNTFERIRYLEKVTIDI